MFRFWLLFLLSSFLSSDVTDTLIVATIKTFAAFNRTWRANFDIITRQFDSNDKYESREGDETNYFNSNKNLSKVLNNQSVHRPMIYLGWRFDIIRHYCSLVFFCLDKANKAWKQYQVPSHNGIKNATRNGGMLLVCFEAVVDFRKLQYF